VKDAGIANVSRSATTALPTPQSILDTGGETLCRLDESLHRDIPMIQANQVLQVVSHSPHGRIDISA
jgi:hypothetical protein